MAELDLNLIDDDYDMVQDKELILMDDNYDLVQDKEQIIQNQIRAQALEREFALGEHMAHTMAYESPKNVHPDIIKVCEEDNVERAYQARTINTGTDRIVASVYVPHMSNLTDPTTNTARIYINLKGTDSLATMRADLEHCPGEETFQSIKAKMMARVNEIIGDVKELTDKPVEVIFSGHSLGGGLAGQTMNEAIRYKGLNLKSHKEVNQFLKEEDKLNNYLSKQYDLQPSNIPVSDREHFDNVTLKLKTWNAAGVSKQVEDYSNNVSNLILSQQPGTISARYGMVGGDAVQTTGEGSVLSKSYADVAVLKVDIGKEGYKTTIAKSVAGTAAGVVTGSVLGPVGSVVGGVVGLVLGGGLSTLNAHCSKHFNGKTEIPQTLKYEVTRNNTDEGQAKITKRLQNKSTVVPTLLWAFHGAVSTGRGFFNKIACTFTGERPRQR